MKQILSNIFKHLRKLWCYKYIYFEECSSLTPGARWVSGGEYYEVEVKVLIPIWIREDDEIEEYYKKWSECNWLYV